MRVLLIEDDELLGDGIASGLRLAGYSIDWVRCGEDGAVACALQTYESIVLDVGLPGMSGIDLLRRLRNGGCVTPILLLTARDTIDDRVQGLDAGADDYLVKPFDLDELQARLRAISRRAQGRATPLLAYGNLTLDPAAHLCRRDGVVVDLTRREFSVLRLLIERCGRVLTRTYIENALYAWGEEIESNAVEVHVHHLRRKLGTDLIRTVRGVGYTIDALP